MAYNILIVDDSSVVRSVISKTINLAHISVNEIFFAENGQVALDILADQWIDIVFADINMPVMSGLDMVKAMAEKDMLDSVPVVIVSTEGSTTRIKQLKEIGVRGYVRKPFTPEKVIEVFNEILGENDEE